MTTHSYYGSLTIVNCASCHMDFGLVPDLVTELRNSRERFYCPKGHSLSYKDGASDAEKLRRAEARETSLRDQLHAAEKEAEKARTTLLRDRQRFANGVCPCCNRTFQNVLRHMKGEHPDYDPKNLTVPRYKCSCSRAFETFAGLRRHQSSARPEAWTDPSLSRWSRHLTVTG